MADPEAEASTEAPATHVTARVPTARPVDAAPMSGFDPHDRFGLTPGFLTRDGRPFIPVSGELHYSRVPRAHWRERLELMRSGGITAVATYVFWLHHEPERGTASFEGELDVAAFVRLCAELDLAVVIRIGPWAHGEARNGGLPDWVQHSGTALRTNDPAYLALVADWLATLGRELAPLCGPDGNVLAIQIENELYDQPDHIATLREMARSVGLRAPIFTATAWGAAQLPEGAVMPLYGGYADGFWVDADAPWDAAFHEHFFFSHVWDDPGIGVDVATRDAGPPSAGAPSERERSNVSGVFPAATCELGGGMATAYHRRPVPTALDIAAVANGKLGNGSVWQGYYMYAGGTNPAADLQESQSTGYPNDLPRFDYDFHAPIGAAGQLAPSHAALRHQHAFLDAFGEWFATLPSVLPDRRPDGVDDRDTPRWAVRSNGVSGMVFVNWHEPFDLLESTPPLIFDLELGAGTLAFPDVPVSIPPGTVARWPFRLAAGGSGIEWATASLLTRLEGADAPDTIVLLAEWGVPPRIALPEGAVARRRVDGAVVPLADGVVEASAIEPTALRVGTIDGMFDLVVLPANLAPSVWVLGMGADRTLLLSRDPVTGTRSTGIRVHATSAPAVARYDPASGEFVACTGGTDAASDSRALSTPAATAAGTIPFTRTRESGAVPVTYGARERRAAAPTQRDIDVLAARWSLDLSVDASLPHARIVIDWAGDVAVLLVDGVPVADRFWDGTPWTLRSADLGIRPGSAVTLQIVPLHPEAPVHVPAAAAAMRNAPDALCELRGVVLELHSVWPLEDFGDAH